MELLPHDAVERILERVPVKSLLRFKSVSKQWKFTIESQYFQKKQLTFGSKPVGDDDDIYVLFVSTKLKTVVFCHTSCDGLVCLDSYLKIKSTNLVFNPTTRWHRSFPLSRLQQLFLERFKRRESNLSSYPRFGFGKDKINGTYKPVRLCNSSELGLENATTCEVFDFSTNAWRYITPSSPYRVLASTDPLYFYGSLYWLTEEKETKVLSLDLHTETFQIISKLPSVDATLETIIICNLNNRLCVSIYNPTEQAIWSFNSETKTWEPIYSIVSGLTPLFPLAILEKNKLLYSAVYGTRLFMYDPTTKSLDSLLKDGSSLGFLACYVKSLISIL
ncbi:PREDICTED: F-box protein At2g34280-like [Camelina sativa]|uniref:F-box protein At2g34280-like n=1 Tax=Camelina sativa TaxID=90675 RepID=A0ABM0X4F2_CAMSA|nr:PREDICTED: F-box protein At2g34280-like [Camelina sativa]